MSNPFDQFDGPTATQPVPDASQAQAPAANPFDQFDDHPHVGLGALTAPVEKMAPTPAASPSFDDAEAWRSELSGLINGGATKDQIGAAAARHGIQVGQLQGLEQALAYRAAHHHSPIVVGLKTPVEPEAHDVHAQDHGKLDSFVAGALDTVSMGAGDEIGGAIGAAANSVGNLVGLGSGESFGDAYTRMRDENRQILSDDQHYNPGTFLAGQVAGGVATIPLGGGEMSAARALGEGALYGGAYGFNSANGDLGDRLKQGAQGAVLGGVMGGVVGGVAGRIARGIEANRATPSAGREILNAADRLNAGVDSALQIRPLAGHVSNGGMASNVHALMEPSLLGGTVSGLHSAANQFEQRGGQALQRIADNTAGAPVDNLTNVAARANDDARAGSLAAYRADSKQASDAIYNNAEQLARGAQLSTPRTINAIDAKLAEWRQVPGGVAGMRQLEDLREHLANGTFTVDGLRRLRTSFGDGIDSNNRTVKEAATALWPMLTQDITQGLRSAGMSDAANAYRAADRNYAQRLSNLGAISKVIGKDADMSADAVAGRLQSMSQNDYDKLGQAMSAIDPAQANAIRGGLIHSLGQRQASRAGESGEFSFESFATRWNKMSDQAKSATFAPGTIRDLNDLSTLALANRNVNRLGNSSRSGTAMENYRQVRGVGELAAGIPLGIAHPGLAAAMIGTGITGHILSYPGVARALVALGENRPIGVVAKRLGEAARRNPAAAQSILGLRDHLTNPDHAVTLDTMGTQEAPAP